MVNDASGINNDGDVVGTSYISGSSGTSHAFLYSNGSTYDLNSRVNPTLGWTISAATDINENGQICGYGSNGTTSDASFILDPAILGDANLDGHVTITDLGTLIDNYGTQSGATWFMGDFNDDGKVTIDDLGVLIDYYGDSFGTAHVSGSNALMSDPAAVKLLADAGFSPVPEPSTLALLVCGLLSAALFAWRKRR